MKLADTSIRRPVFAVMLIGALVVLGIVSIPRLGIDLWPRVEFPMVVVTTKLAGAAPETVEREVSQILEESINTIEGISSLRSTSSDSLSLIFVEFELEYDVQEKAQEVREKVAVVLGQLPRDVEMPVVERVDPDSQPVLVVLLAGPAVDPRDQRVRRQAREAAARAHRRRRQRDAGREPQARDPDLDRPAASGRLRARRRRRAGCPASESTSSCPAAGSRPSSASTALRTKGKLTSADQFGAVVVAERGGSVIHLRDVATVEDGMAEERTISRLGDRRGVALQVRRQSGENTVAVVDAVERELASIRADLPAGYEMLEARDASRFIRSSIFDVVSALIFGALLASMIVLLFLRDIRSTLITATAIPSSIMASFPFFYFFGFTLNTMTLMALSLSIGLLIDDAIVVIENTFRHMELGESPRQAASNATEEIGLAVLASAFANRSGVRSDRIHDGRRRALLSRVRDRRHLHRRHVQRWWG